MHSKFSSIQTRKLLAKTIFDNGVRSPGAKALQADTPTIFPVIAPWIRSFCRDELGCLDVRQVQILHDENASETVMDNVTACIATHGGKTMFGWKITESELFIRAEFHAVIEDDYGTYDPTPIRDRALICFAVDSSVPDGFDYSKRPGPISVSKYSPPRVVDDDQFDVALTHLLECSDELDELKIRARRQVTQAIFEAFTSLARRKRALEAEVMAEFEQRARLAKKKRH